MTSLEQEKQSDIVECTQEDHDPYYTGSLFPKPVCPHETHQDDTRATTKTAKES